MKLVIVGNGMAGVRTLEELLKIAPDVYDITVFGAEPHANYNRILLSPVLAGELTILDIMLNHVDWYEKNGVTLHLNKKVAKIDRRARKVVAADGTEAGYDRLLLATGSNPFILPVPGKDLEGVITYRDIGDTNAMIEASKKYKHAGELAADLVVMAVGIRPNTELAQSAGLYCSRGIVVNDTMQTFDPRIYAVGECVAHRGVAYGLVAPLFEMAKVCANHLAHFGIGRYAGSVISTKLKVTGIDLFSAGDFTGAEGTEEIVLHDPEGGVYKKLVLKDNRIVGGVLYGDTVDSSWYLQLLRDKQGIHEIRDHLMFGQSHLGNSGHQGQNRAVAMADAMEVCGCNGVPKSTIVRAIKEKGLFTLEDVRKHTKASSSCGSCTGLVEQLLASTVGGAYQPQQAKTKPLCACTDHTHEEVRKAIREHKLLSISAAMRFLEWRTPDGCASCRPAINYYLICAWPHQAKDDPQSRFINERAHANIQKDGTFSVVPRMFGGITSPDQLRRIADVADKYKIPTVKVTGGQRIDLLGVKKEDL